MDGNRAEPAGPVDAGHEPDPRWPGQAQQTGGYGFPYSPAEVDGGFTPSDTSPIPLGPLYLQTPYRDPTDDPSAAGGPGGPLDPYQSAGPRGYLPAGAQPPYPPGVEPAPGGPTGPPAGENWANWFEQPDPGYGPPAASPWRQPAQPTPWDQPLAPPAYPAGYPQPPAYPPPTDAGAGFMPTDATSAIPITAFRESLPPEPGRFPAAQYPAGQYPTTQYPTTGFPVEQAPEARYPATEQYAQPAYPPAQYPVDQPASTAQYPTGQYPAPAYQAGTFPAAPYQDPLTLGAYGQEVLRPGDLGQPRPTGDPWQPAADAQQARYAQPPAATGPYPGPAQPAAPDFSAYYQPPPTDVASGGFAPSDTSAIPITAFRESLAARPAARPVGTPRDPVAQHRVTKPASATGTKPAVDGGKAAPSAPPVKHGVRRARLRRRRQLAAVAALGVVIVAIATAVVLHLVDGGSSTSPDATPTFAVGGQGSAKSYPFPVFALTRSGAPATHSMSPGGALGAALGTAGSGSGGAAQLVLTPVAPTPATPPVAAHT
ncbi:hypothetical protein [Pseudofrankia sp. DC12]|uniref:hypothetical protein n=1 Tax=Pseudofrankia sp. DC12 TaxID=683315 RepID=UPI0005F7E07C|nr:hypothetical protein [Pseudofrankia sp. DC12]